MKDSAGDREANKPLVEPKLDAFKARLGFPIIVDGTIATRELAAWSDHLEAAFEKAAGTK